LRLATYLVSWEGNFESKIVNSQLTPTPDAKIYEIGLSANIVLWHRPSIVFQEITQMVFIERIAFCVRIGETAHIMERQGVNRKI